MSQQSSNLIQQDQRSFGPTQPSVENFLAAVDILFHSKDQTTRNAANKYLIQFDKFQESWDISLQILSMPNLTDEAYFNILQVLKNKIKYDFGNYFEHKDIIHKLIYFLFDNFEIFNTKKNYILSNYCYCFALALVFTGESFGEIMKECVKKLNSDNLPNIMSLLMLFNHLGEVYFDNQIVIDDQNKEIFDKNLTMIGKDVITFINYVIQKYSNETREQLCKSNPELTSLFKVLNLNLLETFAIWIQFGLHQDTLISLKNENSAILDFVFQIDQNIISNQTKCIVELLKFPMEDKLKDLGNVILNKLLPFKDTFYQSIQNMEKDDAAFFIDIFTTLVTYNFDEIFKDKRFDLIQLIIDLIKICPSTKIDLICDFWESFSQFLVVSQIAPTIILAQFKGLFQQMILNSINLIEFDGDIFRELNLKKTKYLKNNDDYTTVIDYRSSIKKLFINFSKEYTFELFYNDILLGEINNAVNNIKLNSSDIKGWARLEALFFTFYCICSEVKNMKDISFLTILFDIILEIPTSFSQITRTVTFIIDYLGRALSKNPLLLIKAFNYLQTGLDNPIVEKYCSISARTLLTVNKEVLSSNKSELVNFYNVTIKAKVLNNKTYLSLLEGIVEVICFGENGKEIQGYVVDIMTIWVVYFSEAKSKCETSKDLTDKELNQIVELIDILKSIIRAAYDSLSYDCMVILTQIFIELWPGIKYFLSKYQTNHNIIETLMQLIKCFMRGMKSDFKPYLGDYITIIIQGYKIIPISSYLYGFEVLMTVFCNDKSVYQIMNDVFYELISCTFTQYIKSTNDLENNIDLGQDFFGLLCRMVNLCPLLIFNSALFDQLFSFTIMNIGISHIGMAKSIISFISKIIKFSELPFFNELDKEIISQLTIVITEKINKHCDNLMAELLTTLTQVPPQMLVEYLKTLFFKCAQYFPQTTHDSFAKSLVNLPSDCLTNKEKKIFLSYINNYNEKQLDNSIDKLFNRCQSKFMRAANRYDY